MYNFYLNVHEQSVAFFRRAGNDKRVSPLEEGESNRGGTGAGSAAMEWRVDEPALCQTETEGQGITGADCEGKKSKKSNTTEV